MVLAKATRGLIGGSSQVSGECLRSHYVREVWEAVDSGKRRKTNETGEQREKVSSGANVAYHLKFSPSGQEGFATDVDPPGSRSHGCRQAAVIGNGGRGILLGVWVDTYQDCKVSMLNAASKEERKRVGAEKGGGGIYDRRSRIPVWY